MRPCPPIIALALAALALGGGPLGCAGDLEPDTAPGRQGRFDAVGLPVDLGVPDAAPDGAPPPDAGPTVAPAHAVWWVVRHDPWSAGVRAALDPPHAPAAPDALPDPADGFLVEWAGPQSEGEAHLTALRAQGHPAAPLYDLAARADDVRADVGWLASRHLGPDGLTLGDAPTLAVRWAEAPPGARAAWLDGLATLPEPVAWIAVLGDEPVPAGAAAVLPLGAYGHSPSQASPAGDAAARLARQREAARAAGATWLPRARPGVNRRLDQAGALVDDPGPLALTRSLVLARRAARGVVVVDGWGAWRDDRQLDPVQGEATQQPAALTSGRTYAGYGNGRLAQVVTLLGTWAGPPPGDLARAPALLPLFEAPGVSAQAEYDDRGVAVALVDEGGADGRRLEWLLDARPFVVPARATLGYTRTHAALAVDLVFADGQRLLALAPPADGLDVRIALGAFAGRRVDEVALVAFAGGPRWQGRIDGLSLAP